MAVYFCSRCGQSGKADAPAQFGAEHAQTSRACEGFPVVHSSQVAVSLASGGYELRCPILGCAWCNRGDPEMQDADRAHRSPGHQVHYSDASRRQLFDAHIEWHSMRGAWGKLPVSADTAEIETACNRLCELLRRAGKEPLASAIHALVLPAESVQRAEDAHA